MESKFKAQLHFSVVVHMDITAMDEKQALELAKNHENLILSHNWCAGSAADDIEMISEQAYCSRIRLMKLEEGMTKLG